MSVLDRLKGDEEPKIPVHYFYGALIGLADGQITRAQIEAGYEIGTTGADAVEMDFLITTYNNIVADPFASVGNAQIRQALQDIDLKVKQQRYLNAVHAIFMLTESDEFNTITKAQAQAWLTLAAL